MTPERLAQLKHHHERHAHFTHEMVVELLGYVAAQAAVVERLRGELEFANRHSLQAMSFVMNSGMSDWTEKDARSYAAFLRISMGARSALDGHTADGSAG